MSTPCFAAELVTFDIGGTLLTFRPDQVQEWCVVLSEVGVTVEAARIEAALAGARPRAAAHRRATVGADHRVSVEAGEARRRRFIVDVLRDAGVSDADLPRAEAAMKAAFDSPRMYVAFDDALPVLRELWLRGLKLAAISNTWPAMPKILMALGFDEYLGYWVVSEFLGVEKPAPAIFERALDIAGAEPARAIHVGDDLATDVEGALGVGMRAVLLDRSGRAQRDGRVPVIQRLDELLTIVE
jgi:putative hydrolase of the HAD superfamily